MAPDPVPGRGFRLPRARRISSGAEIRFILRRGKRSRMRHLDVFVSASPASYNRAGWIVPLYGHGTVERNRLKRRLREVLRVDVLPRLDALSGPARDVLVRVRREAYSAESAQLREELIGWLDRLDPPAGSSP